jgi:hypothetical protein
MIDVKATIQSHGWVMRSCSASFSELENITKPSEGYRTYLGPKDPACFEHFGCVVCGCSSSSDRILDVGRGTGVRSTHNIMRRNRNVVRTDLPMLFLRVEEAKVTTEPACVTSGATRLLSG